MRVSQNKLCISKGNFLSFRLQHESTSKSIAHRSASRLIAALPILLCIHVAAAASPIHIRVTMHKCVIHAHACPSTQSMGITQVRYRAYRSSAIGKAKTQELSGRKSMYKKGRLNNQYFLICFSLLRKNNKRAIICKSFPSF